MRRVCALYFLAYAHPHGEYLIGDPAPERHRRFLNLRTRRYEKRNAIADRETRFLPQPLDPAYDLARETFEAELAGHRRIDGGKISALFLYHHLARSLPDDSHIF